MFDGGWEICQENMSSTTSNPFHSGSQQKSGPYVTIVEQPVSKALRFRFPCDRWCSPIPGEFSTPENKTFPTIRVIGYQGSAQVIVSCVSTHPPYRPHPYSLMGRLECKSGVCRMKIHPETMTVTFAKLGVRRVRNRDIEEALRKREEIGVDPFKTGFDHRNQPIDVNALRLCFQVFLEEEPGKFSSLAPVISNVVYDLKSIIIVKLSDYVSSVGGGTKDIILLCQNVAKENIKIRFYEENHGRIVWDSFANFQPSYSHKQTALWFRAPKYKTLEVTEPVKVKIQLVRPSDGATSESLPFELLPLDSDILTLNYEGRL